jgi:hypothetical protein
VNGHSKSFGKNETMSAIGDLIPFDDPKVPILHHVAKHAPHMLKDFGSRYPSATYFRDRLLRGRTLHHPHMLKDFERKYPSATYFRDRLLKGRTSS